MTSSRFITDVLGGQLDPNGGIVGLAEQVLATVAADEESLEFAFEFADATDTQTQRLIRPLLACLAKKSIDENGVATNIYFGPLQFQRPGPDGPTWIVGEFDNRMGSIWIKLRRSTSPVLSLASTMQPADIMTAPPATTK